MEANTQRKAGSEEARVIRDMIKHENDLMNHRFAWFNTLQGLLFAGLAFAWGKDDTILLIIFLSILGIVLSLSSFYIFRTSQATIKGLHRWWQDNKSEEYIGPDVIGHARDSKSIPILRPWFIFPICFVGFWFATIAISLL